METTLQLTSEEKIRYDRHLKIKDFGETSQLKLKASSVLIVGAGGLGCPIVQYLTAAGVGKIGIIDADEVSLSNLQRQILYTEKEIGQPKAQMSQQKMFMLNKNVEIRSYVQFLTEENAEAIMSEYDIVVGATDNFESRKILDKFSDQLNIPFVHGSILEFEGQVSVFLPNTSPRYKDLFPDTPSNSTLSLGVMGVLPGVIGSLMATEVIKLICNIGVPLSQKLLLYNTLNNNQTILNLNNF